VSTVQITPAQLDAIAARVRRRGAPAHTAQHEWLALSDADREFWRDDVRQALAAGKVMAP
jgi:hypothetical protein